VNSEAPSERSLGPQNGDLALDRLWVAEAMPDVGVPGDKPERFLLATAADEHRNLARRRRVQLGQPRLNPRQRHG
jgi:hypothetical protein